MMAQYEVTVPIVVNPDGTFYPVLPPVAEDTEGQEGLIYVDGERIGGFEGYADGELERVSNAVKSGITENITARVIIRTSPEKLTAWHNAGTLKARLLRSEKAKAAEEMLSGYVESSTDWEWRVYLWILKTSATDACIAAYKQIYIDNGNIEIPLTHFKYSVNGSLPALVYGVNILATTKMKDAFTSWVTTYLPKYAATSATGLNGYAKDKIIATNISGGVLNSIKTFEQVEAVICSQFNIQRIQ